MKPLKPKKFDTNQWIMTIPLMVVVSACGSSEPVPTTPNVGTVPGSSVTGAPSCVPLSQQIPFTLTGGQIAQRHIVAGNVPGRGAVGSITTGGIAQSGGAFYGQGAYGTIQLNLNLPQQQSQMTSTVGMTGTSGVLNPYGFDLISNQSANGAGLITLNTQTQDLISRMVTSGQIQIPSATSSLCVSGLAIEFDISDNVGGVYKLFNGEAFLYLNNSVRGVQIQF